jgi:hypothetical protein
MPLDALVTGAGTAASRNHQRCTAASIAATRPNIEKGLDPDLAVMSLKLARLTQGQMRREADLPGALKNPDQAADKPPPGAPRHPPPKTLLPLRRRTWARRVTSN